MSKPTEGQVFKRSGNKTVAVLVFRKKRHATYGKYQSTAKKLLAHDEHNLFKTGDTVRIKRCKPHSKLKTWEVLHDS